jgi:NADP-dependent 3-hydroxy acid dehydrogenase YdfG
MLARRSGKVINIFSWTAHQGGRDMVLYTTTKTALAGFDPGAGARMGALRRDSGTMLSRYLDRWILMSLR